MVVEGENGRYVQPGDPSTLNEEIRRLLSHPEEAVRLGANGRKLVERQINLDLYVQRLTGFLHETIEVEGRSVSLTLLRVAFDFRPICQSLFQSLKAGRATNIRKVNLV